MLALFGGEERLAARAMGKMLGNLALARFRKANILLYDFEG